MNLILVTSSDFTSEQAVRLRGRRLEHILQFHRPEVGKTLKVGLLDGLIGVGKITLFDQSSLEMDIRLTDNPPPQLPVTLVMALPRPKMLKRIFQTVATLGIKELILINAYKVEKSYWQSPWLQQDKITEHLMLGLEQGVATQLPDVKLVKRFKPFVEDELPAICQGKRCLVAHPYDAQPCPDAESTESVIAIGPEGGFIEYEINKLQEAGMEAIELGQRILRVETALPYLIGKLF